MNRSFLSSLAAVRTRSSPGNTLARLGVRRVLVCPVFSSSLRSTNSGSGRPTPFASFPAVGSEEACSIALALASVRRPNWTCSFPASSFHEDALL